VLLVMSSSARISRFSAISRFSIKSLGRFCCRFFRSVLIKVVPSDFSSSLDS